MRAFYCTTVGSKSKAFYTNLNYLPGKGKKWGKKNP